MARRQFAIEPPRRISISIEGYDPGAHIKGQQRKRQKRSRRLRRELEPASKPRTATATLAGPVNAGQGDDEVDELDALNTAAACRPPPGRFEEDLRTAFAGVDDALLQK
jgi:hypothetical protein